MFSLQNCSRCYTCMTRKSNRLSCCCFFRLSQATAVSKEPVIPLWFTFCFTATENSFFLQTFTRESNEFGGSERFSQLVLGLHGDHCIQIFCRLRKQDNGTLTKINTAWSVPSTVRRIGISTSLRKCLHSITDIIFRKLWTDTHSSSCKLLIELKTKMVHPMGLKQEQRSNWEQWK